MLISDVSGFLGPENQVFVAGPQDVQNGHAVDGIQQDINMNSNYYMQEYLCKSYVPNLYIDILSLILLRPKTQHPGFQALFQDLVETIPELLSRTPSLVFTDATLKPWPFKLG